MALFWKTVFFIVCSHIVQNLANVIELDDRFLEARKDGFWLVQFYAPWCGHCKKLEPVYSRVAAALKSTPIIVAKIDGTRFGSVGTEFNVRGFPTIKFIKGDTVYTHNGDRTKEAIMEFAKRAQGPAVRPLSSIGKFNEAHGEHSDGVFFLYVGDQDPEGDGMSKYKSIAETYAIHGYFYTGEEKILPQHLLPSSFPALMVFKDGTQFTYDDPEGFVNSKMEEWVNSERYSAFPLVFGGGINDMAESGKRLVIIGVNSEEKERATANERLKDVANLMATKQRSRYHKDFQFLWMNDLETLTGITMSDVPSPCLLVLDTNTHLYYMPVDTDIGQMTVACVDEFLQDVINGKAPAFGGTGIGQKLKRVAYDIITTVVGVWQTSKIMFFIMFCLPTGVISIVCYTLCCATWDENEYREEDYDSDEPEQPEPEHIPDAVKEEHETNTAGAEQLRERKKKIN